jgi:rhodanese-related sulfurtransferase
MKTAQQLIAEAKTQIKEVDIAQLAAVLQQQADTILIDVREPAEFAKQHIAGAVNYPRGVLEMNIHKHPKVAANSNETERALQQLAQSPMYVICHSGGRSALATASLQQMGFTDIYSVSTGMQGWLDAKLPIVT